MPDKSEKARRKSIKSTLRNEERQQAQKSFPVPVVVLHELFDFLDGKLTENECDHTLNSTREFARNHTLPEERLIVWLEQSGGYCDCEVLANVEQVVEDAERYKNEEETAD